MQSCSLLVLVVVAVCVRACMCDYVTIIVIVKIIFYRTVQYSILQYVPVSEYSLTLMDPQSGQLIFTSYTPLIAHKHALENLWE